MSIASPHAVRVAPIHPGFVDNPINGREEFHPLAGVSEIASQGSRPAVNSAMSELFKGRVTPDGVRSSRPEDGLVRQVLAWNSGMMLVRHQMQPGWRGARHSHPHEQMVYVVRGHIRFICGGETFEAATGDSFIVPGGMEHEASALAESEVLDFFVPYREDYAT
ncbi:MAG TPA: cupin domain-containing protein [Acidobacteriaceae bacterium]|nr:cupin domain-containing protein [Acidobacteriaceae bacterium]